MNFLKRLAEEKRAEFMAHVSPEIQERLADSRPMTWKEYVETPMNSYEMKLMVPLLDDSALQKFVQQCLDNCSYRPLGRNQIARHYDEAVIGELLPLVLKRLQAITAERNELIFENSRQKVLIQELRENATTRLNEARAAKLALQEDLHSKLDLITAMYLSKNRGKRISTTTVKELLEWSFQQSGGVEP